VADSKKEFAFQDEGSTKMKRVAGIGGVFFKSKDPAKMREWYQKHLGFKLNEYGTLTCVISEKQNHRFINIEARRRNG
jgi:hypothetical protein